MKTKTVYSWLLLVLTLFTGCVTDTVSKLKEEKRMNPEEISNAVSIENKKNLDNAYLVNPFNLLYEKSDIHVMLYFTGHPEYESIEAMICDKNTNDIRVIITRHDQTQIDYMNNKEKVDRLQRSGTNREVYYAQIDYRKNIRNSRPEVGLLFRTIDNEQVDFKLFCAGKPSKKHAGLTNPEGHSATTSLPVMYRDLSTLASTESSVVIDGVKYAIPVLIQVPIFFTGLKGYYSENFKMGIIRAGEQDSEIIQYPNNYTVGEKWVYKTSNGLCEYTINKREHDLITITGLHETLTGIVIDDKLGISEISVSSVYDDSSMCISFDTPLFNILDNDTETDFTIAIDEHTNLIRGTIIYRNKTDVQEYQLIPSAPAWAQSRKMNITVCQKQHNINWKCKVD